MKYEVVDKPNSILEGFYIHPMPTGTLSPRFDDVVQYNIAECHSKTPAEQQPGLEHYYRYYPINLHNITALIVNSFINYLKRKM